MSATDPKRTLRSRFHTRVLSFPVVLASSRGLCQPATTETGIVTAAGQRGLTVTTAPPLTYINRLSRLSSTIQRVGLGTSHADQVSSARTFTCFFPFWENDL